MTVPDTPLAINPTENGFAVVGEIDAHTAPEISEAVARATRSSPCPRSAVRERRRRRTRRSGT